MRMLLRVSADAHCARAGGSGGGALLHASPGDAGGGAPGRLLAVPVDERRAAQHGEPILPHDVNDTVDPPCFENPPGSRKIVSSDR